MADPWIWPASLGLLGLVFGSFIATLAIRWPEGRSSLSGRSACDGCNRTLRAIELVPVLSFLAQRGRCRSCGASIAPSHLAVELLALAVGIASGLAAPGWPGVAGAVFGWLLLTLAAIDLRAFWLPDPLTATLALLGIGGGLVGLDPPLVDRLIGGVAGFGVLWLVAAAYRAARGRMGLGGGDPKLFGAIGLWLGWRALPLVLLLACLLGLAVVLASRIRRRPLTATDRLPLGTLLAPAAFLLWLLTQAAA
ncbi:prepilin peptidase [Sphingomonas sp. PL-96]|uniref:prepilin peptidase n=1 Tax=Sphingomonas sp. PL-96 TaxID=2887201 RepID=UPI001E46B411|nr:A24 family peptidase [Sphingomonas sp. PL-96]MCC2975645.1 prepilin peptidase [Sphingomonas sp. PL-96]